MNLADLTTRNRQPELMDDPAISPSEHRHALDGLARIHRVTRSAQRFWKTIKSNFVCQAGPLTVLDIGCGDGFLLRSIVRLARKDCIDLTIVGCDISPVALKFARQHAEKEGVAFEAIQLDILSAEIPLKADIVISSLFMHHFEAWQVVQILKKLNRVARRGVVIEDLRRTHLGYALCWLGTRTLSRSPIVHTDGLLSVAAAFSFDEFSHLVEHAGIVRSSVSKQWPERMMVSWHCHEEIA